MESKVGRVFNVNPNYISNPENNEFITIYRNKLDNKYYGRREDGVDEPISPEPLITKKKYQANLTQNGVNPPNIVLGENSLDVIPTSSYQTTGVYFLTALGQFINGKTFVTISGSKNGNIEAYRIDDDNIRINTYQGGIGVDGILSAPTCITIEVNI